MVLFLVRLRGDAVPTITASDARRSLFPLLGQVNEDHSVVTITSKAGNGVLLSEEDYEAWQTTMYLFSTPANARRLSEAIERSDRGEYAAHELDRS
jgi:antitoxin YefM